MARRSRKNHGPVMNTISATLIVLVVLSFCSGGGGRDRSAPRPPTPARTLSPEAEAYDARHRAYRKEQQERRAAERIASMPGGPNWSGPPPRRLAAPAPEARIAPARAAASSA